MTGPAEPTEAHRDTARELYERLPPLVRGVNAMDPDAVITALAGAVAQGEHDGIVWALKRIGEMREALRRGGVDIGVAGTVAFVTVPLRSAVTTDEEQREMDEFIDKCLGDDCDVIDIHALIDKDRSR